MNDAIQDLINGLADKSSILDAFMRFSALDLIFIIAAIPPLLWFWPAEPARRAANQRVAATAVLSVAVALVAARIAGLAHWEARPFISDADTRLLIGHSPDNSFPSDHATMAFAVAGCLLSLRPPLGRLVLAAGILVAVARVFVGVHWPDDVLAAALIGLACGWLFAYREAWLVPPQRALSRFMPRLLLAPPQ